MDFTNIVDELNALVNSGTRVPGLRKKVVVDVDRLMALGEKMRNSIPPSIREAEAVLTQKESIISQANLEAQRVKGSAEQEATSVKKAAQQEHWSKVEETEIVRVAQAKAQEIREQATMDAQQTMQDAQRRAHRILNEAEAASSSRRDGADQYSREVLFSLEEQLAELLGQVRRGIDTLRQEEVEGRQAQDKVAA